MAAKTDNTMLWLLGGAAVVGLALYATQASAAPAGARPATLDDDDDDGDGPASVVVRPASTQDRKGFSFRRTQRPTDRRREEVIRQTMQGVDVGAVESEELEMQFFQIMSLIQTGDPDAVEDLALWLMQLSPDELAYLQENVPSFTELAQEMDDEDGDPSMDPEELDEEPPPPRRQQRQMQRGAAQDMRQAQRQAVRSTRKAAKAAQAPQAQGMVKGPGPQAKGPPQPKAPQGKPPPGPDGRQGFWG